MKGFKTISVAAIISFMGILQQADMINIIPDHYRGIFISSIGLIMAVLRLQTDSKVFSDNN